MYAIFATYRFPLIRLRDSRVWSMSKQVYHFGHWRFGRIVPSYCSHSVVVLHKKRIRKSRANAWTNKTNYLSIASSVRMSRSIAKFRLVRGTVPMTDGVLHGCLNCVYNAARSTVYTSTAATVILVRSGCLGGVSVLLFNFSFGTRAEHVENGRSSIGTSNA